MTLLEAVQTNKMKIPTVMELLEKLIFTVFKVRKIKLHHTLSQRKPGIIS